MRISGKLKDEIYLLIAGLGCALLAAKFWGFFQSAGFDIIYIAMILALAAENGRLKKRVKELQRESIQK